MHITATYEQSAAEAYRGTRVALRARRRIWWACSVALLLAGGAQIALGRTLLGVLWAALGVVLALQFTVRVKRAIARALRQSPGSMKVVLDDEKAVFRKPGSKSEVEWYRFVKVAESEEFFHLYLAKVTVVSVPKRAFEPAEAAEVSQFLTALPNYSAR
ncbi:YcxB family protein [Kitasatospora sp. NPDC052896]|uniref:YcxB family protein n=1 Tax=Kitasatospora sp. NPDC052896 TaxID=3364061 RepID=UPI0037C87040